MIGEIDRISGINNHPIPRIYRHHFYTWHLNGYIKCARVKGDKRSDNKIIDEWMEIWGISENDLSKSSLLKSNWNLKKEFRDFFKHMDVYLSDNMEDMGSLNRLKYEVKMLKKKVKELGG